jgi:hypothetical protein
MADAQPTHVLRGFYAGRRDASVATLDEALPNSQRGRFGPGGHAEFGKDVGDVGLGGARADEEPVRDLRIAVAGDEQTENFSFPCYLDWRSQRTMSRADARLPHLAVQARSHRGAALCVGAIGAKQNADK